MTSEFAKILRLSLVCFNVPRFNYHANHNHGQLITQVQSALLILNQAIRFRLDW
jgi:hypothetical protein